MSQELEQIEKRLLGLSRYLEQKYPSLIIVNKPKLNLEMENIE